MRWLDEIRERLKKATPGPWHVSDGAVETWVRSPSSYPVAKCTRRCNATFIAHAPTDIATLLEYVERLEAVVRSARESIRCDGCLRNEPTFSYSGDPNFLFHRGHDGHESGSCQLGPRERQLMNALAALDEWRREKEGSDG